MGGGLAGLTLALQLKQTFADLDVLVLERRQHPVPLAAHKVGESTVEIGAHYFGNVLGLKDHLLTAQLKKFGFRFFFSDGRRDIDQVVEIGVGTALPVSSWQIDRGIFENFLVEEAQRRGVRFEDQAVVRQVDMAQGNQPHAVSWQRAGQAAQRSSARWLVDASGRAGLLKKKLDLALGNDHAAHAVWFRVDHRIQLDDWSDDPAWRARTATPTRWLSTNHLVGPGYWVWLIPLASGSHSVGIVADPAYHPLERMNTFERAMQWLKERQPRLFDELHAVVTPAPEKLQDFAFFRRYSYDCKQTFSSQRWALTGEAGRFLDPFYSPGSDFIAMGNTYITELIALDRANKPLAAHAQIYDRTFRTFYDNTLHLFQGQYGLFGDPEVLPHKVIWDYTYYWGVLAQIYFQERLTDLASLSRVRAELAHCEALNKAAQVFFRAWGELSQRRNAAVMLDQAKLGWFRALNGGLEDRLDASAYLDRLRGSTRMLTNLAHQLVLRGCAECPQLDGAALRQVVQAAGGATGEYGDMLFPAHLAPTGASPTPAQAVLA
jgi:flavin-dependent dehydrogenase